MTHASSGGSGESGGLGSRGEAGEEFSVTPEEALQIAVELHQRGAFDRARDIYADLLAHQPDNANAMQFMGILKHQEGESEEGLALLRRAAELVPDDPGILMNTGNILLESGHAGEAVDVYRRMLELAPNSAHAWNNMGVLMRTLGNTELAEEALRKAIELQPSDAGPWHNLGNLLLGVGRVEESVNCALRSLTLLPESRVGRKLLGVAYAYLGEAEKAKDVFRKWLQDEPGDPTAEHHLAALEGRPPDRASDAYVERVFDDFAVSFDARLENLEYRAPELVRDALAARVEGGAPLRVLDLGCGTGLCGPLVRPLASRLVGVDLSARMLARARDRRAYDALEKAEFIGYLAGLDEPIDAIIAADALCYVGRMEEFSHGAARALAPGGVLVATFEADAQGSDMTLAHTGRYTHGRDYLTRTFGSAGFSDLACEPCVLRLESGRPVEGWLLSAVRGA